MIKFVTLLTFSFLFNACASSPNRAQSSPDALQRSLTDLRSIQAEMTAQQAQIQEDIRNLVGRIENLEFRINGRPGGSQVQMPALLPPAPALPPVANNQAPLEPIMRPPTQSNSGPNVAPALTSYDTPPPIVPLNELTADESLVRHLDVQFSRSFTDALYFVRRGEFRQALTLLSDVVSNSKGKDGHAQALFWQGVCYDGIGNNREALIAYNAVVSQYPNSDRARVSLLRLASVFIRLGDTGTAKLTLDKLIAEAPSSREAEQARARLKDLR